MLSRRRLLGAAGGGLALGLGGRLPAWARPASEGNRGLSMLTGNQFDLTVDRFPVTIGGRRAMAVGVNGSLPAPLLRWREGEEVTLNVTNRLDVDTSIHWHGILLPFHMDGVPGVSFPGISPGETFTYRFPLKQSGTYWYHSHSGLQEQIGHYGPMVIDPAGADAVQSDREYVIVLSDWSFEDPHRIFAQLKKEGHSLNFQQRTVGDFFRDAGEKGLGAAWSERVMWGEMRMSPRDIADVTGATYDFLINGHTTADNWNGVFRPGERVRLRIINASAMTIFNVRIPGLAMSVVNADGEDVEPVETDEFQIGVAETYDVVVQPDGRGPYALTAESIDRSGQVVATLGAEPGMRAEAPVMRAVPTLTMKDMGHGGMDQGAMDHGSMDHSAMDHGGAGAASGAAMDHAAMGHGDMGHGEMATASAADLSTGPGIDMVAMNPVSRLDEPGLGLEDVSHRTLRYSQLRSLKMNPDVRPAGREIVVHLTGNMERYMWSFDGVQFHEVTEPFVFHEGERVRMTLVNNTMMNHPIHLHGMYFELDTGAGHHKPRKHTVIVKPGEKLSFDVTADAVGDWGFHCHLLYHMHAGMMQVVSVLPGDHGGHEGHGEHAGHGAGHEMHQPEADAGADPPAAMDHSGHGGHHQ